MATTGRGRWRRWVLADWGVPLAALGLCLVGAMLVHSATHGAHGLGYLIKHLVNTGIGVAIAAVVARTDLRSVRALAPVLWAVAVAGLVLVLTRFGATINGSRSWIRLPAGLSLQPAEFAKAALGVGLALVFAERTDRGLPPRHRDVAIAWCAAGIPVLLVMRQPDLGSAVVLVALTVGVVALSGAPRRWTVGAVLVGVAGVTAMFTTGLLSSYQRDRLLAFLHPQLDPQGIGYQTRQVREAISGGGLTGQGYLHGHVTQRGLVPYQETDFVFSVAGEELGFLGSAGVIALLAFLVIRCLVIAARADAFGRLICVGVAVWLGVQSFENIAMALGVMPVTGLPLPFVSYGGSSMFACWFAIGLVGSVQLQASRRRW